MTWQIGPTPYPGGSLTAFFDRGGLLGAFAAGFLGSGVLGLMFGRGLFGGLSGDASYVGLFCQLCLLVVVCWLIWTRWRSGSAPGAAALSPRQLADAYARSRSDHYPDGDSSDRAEAAKAAPVSPRSSKVSEVSVRDGR